MSFLIAPHSQVPAVIRYIRNQPVHHRGKSFRQEYLQFLHRFAIDHDEKYIFHEVGGTGLIMSSPSTNSYLDPSSGTDSNSPSVQVLFRVKVGLGMPRQPSSKPALIHAQRSTNWRCLS